MMKLWLEELLQILELLIRWYPKLDLKLYTYPLVNNLIFLMLHSDINKLVKQWLFLLVKNMDLVHLEIGLQRDHIFKVLRLLLPNLLKESTEVISLVWVFSHLNLSMGKTLNPLDSMETNNSQSISLTPILLLVNSSPSKQTMVNLSKLNPELIQKLNLHT